MKYILLTICIGLINSLTAQFLDDFSDGDFGTNPSWVGDNSKFAVDSFRLHLQASAVPSNAYLSTASSAINSAVWQFRISLEFNPSNANFIQIYLTSDQSVLTGSLKGYYVRVGGQPDEISLYKQLGTSETKIIDGVDGLVNLSNVDAIIKVTRDDLGNWELLADVDSTGTFSSQGTAFDNSVKASSYFGVLCTYTSTRSDKFYFDDFNILGNPFVDTDPPTISNINIISDTQLEVQFNEALESLSATSIGNFHVDNNVDNPQSAQLLANQTSVQLSFDKSFKNRVSYTLTITNIKDVNGNAINSEIKTFLYFSFTPPKFKDIVITEIFADPNPQINLPDAEFIEIHNRSANPFNLLNWKFSDGNSITTFPSIVMLPNEYLIVTSTSNVTKFGSLPNIVNLSNFPTLNNDGDPLTLNSDADIKIDSVNYSLSWYRDGDKEEGGWSLELIDPDNICGDEQNWTASENANGGTPGAQNSVFANKPDLAGPKLEAVFAEVDKLILSFDEKLENPINPTAAFRITPEIKIVNFAFKTADLRSIILNLASDVQPSMVYNIEISKLYDCSGNVISSIFNNIDFALHESAEQGDIVINEILFNPRPNGVDFVELYNQSNKYINLSDWIVSNINEGMIENSKLISTQNTIFYPKSFLVLTSDNVILKSNYPQSKEDTFLELSLPSFPDNTGSVAISNAEGKVIDVFEYDMDFHSEFINDDEGVSLERISFAATTNSRLNWKSASSTAGFATPGFLNSNFRPDIVSSEGEVTVDPEIFEPNSGLNDFSKINFRFDKPGLIANVKVFDQEGRLIKTLANNENLGFEGFFRWDGDKDNGKKARLGYYFVRFEVFDNDGNSKTFRKRVIVASR